MIVVDRLAGLAFARIALSIRSFIDFDLFTFFPPDPQARHWIPNGI